MRAFPTSRLRVVLNTSGVIAARETSREITPESLSNVLHTGERPHMRRRLPRLERRHPTVVIENRARKLVTDDEVFRAIPALQWQVTRDFEPVWGLRRRRLSVSAPTD